MLAVSAGRVGAVAVSDRDDAKAVVGIITDGDLRRALERDSTDWTSLTARDVMNTAPRSLSSETRAIDALDMLEAHRISQVMVRNAEGHFLGFVHLHHLMDAGIR